MGATEPYRFAIVGGGWRAEFFLRIAAALPERFRIEGLVVRSSKKGQALEARWGCPTFRTLGALLERIRPEFLVSSVSSAANFEVNLALLETGLPILTETPPAVTLEQMRRLWAAVRDSGSRVQVQIAEQFHRQPLHAARLAAIRQERIGTPHTAYLSVCHGYHGTSLIRHFLGLAFEAARITGTLWQDRVLDPGGRNGTPADPLIQSLPQQVALLDFGDGRHAVFDFVGAQYFSPIRAQRVSVRGDRGEIVDQTLFAYDDAGEPVTLPFRRHVAGPNGNLEGHHLKGIQLGEHWLYHNPLAPARLSDEEIAMGDLLGDMGQYVRGGVEPYPLRYGLQDNYLGLLIRQACETGQTQVATPQPWAE